MEKLTSVLQMRTEEKKGMETPVHTYTLMKCEIGRSRGDGHTGQPIIPKREERKREK